VAERLEPEQQELWDWSIRPDLGGELAGPSAVRLAVLSFLFWCDFAGVGQTEPSEEAIRTAFAEAGVPELVPEEDFWRRLRDDPLYPWVLAPGRYAERVDRARQESEGR
jgi:hypothetical protein